MFDQTDTIHDIISKVREMSGGKNQLISEVVTLLKLIIVAPATNAESERMFSSMKRIKTYLRSTMGKNRLNSLMILHVHKDLLDDLNLIDIANKFVGINQRRRNTFGVFTSSDLLCKERVFVRHSSTQTE